MPLPTPKPNEEPRDLTCRTIATRAESIDEKARSVEAVLSTENIVQVMDWARWQVIDEILISRGLEPTDQVVLLENHFRFSLDDVFGSVRQIRIEDPVTVGRLFLDEGDERIERAWGKIKRRHLRDVSVGYKVLDYVEIPPNKEEVVDGKKYRAAERPLRITRRWQLREVSLTPLGADDQAKIRTEVTPQTKGCAMNERLRKYLESIGLRADASEDQAKAFVALLSGRAAQIAGLLESETKDETSKFAARAGLKELGVDPEDPTKVLRSEPPATPPTPPATPPIDVDAARADGQRLERERAATIRRLAGSDVASEVVTRALDEGWDEARASREFLNSIRERRTAPVGPAFHSRDHDRDCTVRSLAAGMLIDSGINPVGALFADDVHPDVDRTSRLTEQDADLGHRFHDLSAIDIARECCRIDTGRMPRGRYDAIRAAVSGGTLNYVFTTNAYARLIAGWEEAGDTTLGWCDEEDVPNFMLQEDISISADARLERLARGDTAKDATISDTHETYRIARYAKKFVADEQDFIDDRLGAIMKMPEELGKAARRMRPDFVYSLILENPALVVDSVAVFHADHANLGAVALSSDNLKAAITAMGIQRENDKVLNITPKYLIVPAALDWTAQGLCTTASIAKLFADSDESVYSTENLIARKRLLPVMDDRIGASGVVDPRSGNVRTGSNTTWYLAAGGPKSIRVAYLRGTGRAPQLRSFTLERGQWGLGWDIKMEIGAAFMDYRPWHKSVG